MGQPQLREFTFFFFSQFLIKSDDKNFNTENRCSNLVGGHLSKEALAVNRLFTIQKLKRKKISSGISLNVRHQFISK